jgi:polyhydroxybutyrate depolymerase
MITGFGWPAGDLPHPGLPAGTLLSSSVMTSRAGLAARLAPVLLAGFLCTPLVAQATAGAQRRTLEVGGTRRSYLVYLPASRQRARPLPLVLVFHGAGGRGAGMARHTGFSRDAERHGYAVVYPDGVNRRWNDGRGVGGTQDDVAFVRALLDSLDGELGVDRRRIYATGISNGAMFAYRLACDLPGTFAAIAPVAGAMPVALAKRCAGAAPVAVASLQGTADPFVPYGGGGVALRRGAVLSARGSADFWARVNGCESSAVAGPPRDSVADGTRLREERWEVCGSSRPVVLYTIEGGGHTWPGGPASGRRLGRASRELDATAAISDFFRRHPGT